MGACEILDPRDVATVHEIMLRTCDILKLQSLNFTRVRPRSDMALSLGDVSLDSLGVSPYCGPASDAVTRAAHGLGLVASREMHSMNPRTIADHYVTSFGPLDRPLSDDDPILCATWGQFQNASFDKRLRKKLELYGFFGKRAEIRQLFSPGAYGRYFSAGSVALRQTVHAPLPPEAMKEIGSDYTRHCWLDTTPEDILSDQFPASEVAIGDYPVGMWELAPLLRRIACGNYSPDEASI